VTTHRSGPCAVTVGMLLDDDHAEAVRRVRQRLGAPATRDPVIPHLSLAVLLDVPPEQQMDLALHSVAARTPPLTVRARGFGVFHGGAGDLVLHVPVVRTDALARIHGDVLDALSGIGAVSDGHYTAPSWFPHITIWDRSLTSTALGRAAALLADGPALAWTLTLTDLARLSSGGVEASIPLRASPRGSVPAQPGVRP
jgi:2'-5' RNA ligase